MPKELLFRMTKADFKVEFFCAGGHGGQKQCSCGFPGG